MLQIEVFQNADELATQAAWEFSELAKKTIAEQGRFVAALSGGSTPKRMFQQLTNKTMDWRHIHLFWVDERCVSPDHPDSNFGMTAAILLNHIEIPMENVHRIQGELPPEQAALNYENELQGFFGQKFPVFDLILLGLGSDGHTASLFPGSPALAEETRWVTAVEHRKPPPPLVDRVTLTFPVLNAGRKLVIQASGKEKRKIIDEFLFQNNKRIPAERINPKQGKLVLMLDRYAAKLINLELLGG